MLTARDKPAYPLAEAARYLKVPVATLRSWVLGRGYPTASGSAHFHPLIQPAQRQPLTLSFSNLIEAHVVRALRSDHGVSIQALREALGYAERTLGIRRLLLSQELCTNAGQVFLEHYGELINLNLSGQLAMQRVFAEHLKRVAWDADRSPIRLYPFLSTESPSAARPIVIDPQIAFGRPVVVKTGVSTRVIVERLDAGETILDLAADYALSPAELEDAVLYERAA